MKEFELMNNLADVSAFRDTVAESIIEKFQMTHLVQENSPVQLRKVIFGERSWADNDI